MVGADETRLHAEKGKFSKKLIGSSPMHAYRGLLIYEIDSYEIALKIYAVSLGKSTF